MKIYFGSSTFSASFCLRNPEIWFTESTLYSTPHHLSATRGIFFLWKKCQATSTCPWILQKHSNTQSLHRCHHRGVWRALEYQDLAPDSIRQLFTPSVLWWQHYMSCSGGSGRVWSTIGWEKRLRGRHHYCQSVHWNTRPQSKPAKDIFTTTSIYLGSWQCSSPTGSVLRSNG